MYTPTLIADLLRLCFSCNQDCVFCTIASESESDLNEKEAKEKIRYLTKHGSGMLTITGGEPTIKPYLPDIISFAKNQGIKRIEIQTNAILLSDKSLANKLVNSRLDVARVSLHSHRESISDELTKVEGSFYKTLKGIQNLLDSGIQVYISHVINTRNFKELSNFVEFISSNYPKINFIRFGFLKPDGNAWKNKWIVPKIFEVEGYLYEALDTCRKRSIDFEIEGMPLCYLGGYEDYCSELRRFIHYGVTYIDKKAITKNVHQKGFYNLKSKSLRCNSCSLNSICPGIWKEYALIKGTSELKIMNKDPNNILQKVRDYLDKIEVKTI